MKNKIPRENRESRGGGTNVGVLGVMCTLMLICQTIGFLTHTAPAGRERATALRKNSANVVGCSPRGVYKARSLIPRDVSIAVAFNVRP